MVLAEDAILAGHARKMYEAAFKLQMIDDQTAAFHMKDLHACARLVVEDERVAVLHVEAIWLVTMPLSV